MGGSSALWALSFFIELELEQVDKVQTVLCLWGLLAGPRRPFDIGLQPSCCLAPVPTTPHPAALPCGLPRFAPGEGPGWSRPHFGIPRTGFLLPVGWNFEA